MKKLLLLFIFLLLTIPNELLGQVDFLDSINFIKADLEDSAGNVRGTINVTFNRTNQPTTIEALADDKSGIVIRNYYDGILKSSMVLCQFHDNGPTYDSIVFTYDELSRVTSRRIYDSTGTLTDTSRYWYDNSVISRFCSYDIIDTSSYCFSYEYIYDDNGMLLIKREHEDNVAYSSEYAYEYNEKSQLIKETYSSGSVSGDTSLGWWNEYAYDSLGRRHVQTEYSCYGQPCRFRRRIRFYYNESSIKNMHFFRQKIDILKNYGIKEHCYFNAIGIRKQYKGSAPGIFLSIGNNLSNRLLILE